MSYFSQTFQSNNIIAHIPASVGVVGAEAELFAAGIVPATGNPRWWANALSGVWLDMWPPGEWTEPGVGLKKGSDNADNDITVV